MAALLTSLGISIHAPREGGDVRPSPPTPNCVLFQSTPPARGATGGRSAAQPALADFNPRPPRGGRLDCIHSTPETITISIHAPREGGDGQLSRFSSQSILISIHAPREGGDYQNHPHQANDNIFQSTPPARGATGCRKHNTRYRTNFNPRPPRGGRRLPKKHLQKMMDFNPRPPRGGRP